MRIRKCDICEENINGKQGASFTVGLSDKGDLCVSCIRIVRQAICLKCDGKGTVSEVDHHATNAQATCGENRTQYRTVACKACATK